MKHKGYNEWKGEGYQVRRGEKMRYRDERGVPMFSEDQVDPVEYDDEEYLRELEDMAYAQGYDHWGWMHDD